MKAPNHIEDAALTDAMETLAALKKRWPQVFFHFNPVVGAVTGATAEECTVGECRWENDPDAPAGEKGTRCIVCGCKIPF